MNRSAASASDDPAAPVGSRVARAAETRERILQAALRLFAKRGYDGTSVDEVVAAAKINKRMVYHYFASKQGLYAAALERVFSQLATIESGIFTDAPSAGVALERLLTVYFNFLREHPEFVSLLLWENLQGGRHFKELSSAVTKAPILDALGKIIDQGIASGELRPEIDKQHMLINLIGLCMIYYSNQHTLSRTVGLDLNDPATLEAGLQHALRLLRHGFLQ